MTDIKIIRRSYTANKYRRIFKKIKSLLDTSIGLCSSIERSAHEGFCAPDDINYTISEGSHSLSHVNYHAEL